MTPVHRRYEYRIEPVGDRALRVRFEQRPSKSLSRFLNAYTRRASAIPGVLDAAAGFRSVLVEVELEADARSVEADLSRIDADLSETAVGTLHELPIRYDGPDLDEVCQMLALDRGTFTQAHRSRTYEVALIGSPGFIYLMQVPRSLAVPRVDDPRPVPAGSVGIAGRQSGIYTRPRPGGWRIIGSLEELPRISPGDRVRFA